METKDSPEQIVPADDQRQAYDVGYGKPPVTSRFQPGQSGNPRGRPKASRNSKTIHNEIMDEKVPVRSGGRQRKVPRREAMFLKLVTEALGGNLTAIRLMLDNDARFNPAVETETGIGKAEHEALKALRRLLETRPAADTPETPDEKEITE